MPSFLLSELQSYNVTTENMECQADCIKPTFDENSQFNNGNSLVSSCYDSKTILEFPVHV